MSHLIATTALWYYNQIFQYKSCYLRTESNMFLYDGIMLTAVMWAWRCIMLISTKSQFVVGDGQLDSVKIYNDSQTNVARMLRK